MTELGCRIIVFRYVQSDHKESIMKIIVKL